MNICIVGGGNASYSAIALLSQNPEHRISLLTHRPVLWKSEVTCRFLATDQSETDRLVGRLHRISRNPAQVVADADIIVIVAPVYAYRYCLDWIAPSLKCGRDLYLGFLYGQGGVNWMVNAAIKTHGLKNVHYWSFGLIPWICRAEVYGACGANYGAKRRNVICTSSDQCYFALKENVLDDFSLKYFGYGEVFRADKFIELTLSVDNQVIHPSRCFALWSANPYGWESRQDVPYFYRDFDSLSEEVLIEVDQEYGVLRDLARNELPNSNLLYMLNYIDLERFSYDSVSPGIQRTFRESGPLRNIDTPTRQVRNRRVIDASHRFFIDDTYHGLGIAKEIASRFGVQLPMVERLLTWSTDMMRDQKVTPKRYATNKSHRETLTLDELFE